MSRRGPAVSPLLAGLALCALPACHTRPSTPDGGPDASGSDASAGDAQGALALDFAATGCAARPDGGALPADGGVVPCTGTAPLTLTFSPVGSAALTRFLWTFGDGTPPSSDRAPTHTYRLPGTYDVTLAAEGSVGSVSLQRPGFVDVGADGPGTPCDVDGQCAAGLFCLCGEGSPCGPAFPRGVCTRACPSAGCGAGAACARVEVPATPAADAGTDAGAPGGAVGDAGDGSAAIGEASDGPVGPEAPVSPGAGADVDAAQREATSDAGAGASPEGTGSDS